MLRPTLARIADLVLTTDKRKRAALRMWALSVSTYLLYNGILLLMVAMGYAPAMPVWALIIASTLANAGFYLGIRKSWGPRWDRSLGVTQLLVGIVFMWLTYALAG